MEEQFVLCCIAVGAAVACGALAIMPAKRPSSPGAEGGLAFGRILRRGVPSFHSAAEMLLSLSGVRDHFEHAVLALEGKGVATDVSRLAQVFVSAGVVFGIAGVFVLGAAWGFVVGFACYCGATWCWSDSRMRRSALQVRDAAPDAISALGSCLQSGSTLLQAFERTAEEVPGQLGQSFAHAASVLQTGGSAEEALNRLRCGLASREMAFVAVALDVQHQAGGSMRDVLENARDSVVTELELERSLRVQTAQAQLSARIVSVMPVALVAVLSLVSEGFLDPFFESFAGTLMLLVAVAMQMAGIFLVRRTLKAAV